MEVLPRSAPHPRMGAGERRSIHLVPRELLTTKKNGRVGKGGEKRSAEKESTDLNHVVIFCGRPREQRQGGEQTFIKRREKKSGGVSIEGLAAKGGLWQLCFEEYISGSRPDGEPTIITNGLSTFGLPNEDDKSQSQKPIWGGEGQGGIGEKWCFWGRKGRNADSGLIQLAGLVGENVGYKRRNTNQVNNEQLTIQGGGGILQSGNP